MTGNAYTKRLEDIIKQMLQPLRDIPFNLVIETVSGKKVLNYNPDNTDHSLILSKLQEVAKNAGVKINKTGILRPRPNEVGNDIEEHVKKAFEVLNIKSEIPEFLEPDEDVYPIIKTFLKKCGISEEKINKIESLTVYDAKPNLSNNDSKKLKNIFSFLLDLTSKDKITAHYKKFGERAKNFSINELKEKAEWIRNKFLSKKATGYPDIIFWHEDTPYYLECKTYNLKNISTTQRSFYFSPSENFKVIHDAVHFMLSFEIYVAGESGNNHIYKCKHYKILSIESLSVDVKYEFNSDNKRLYSGDYGTRLLAEGAIK
jgi:hypothetical protein